MQIVHERLPEPENGNLYSNNLQLIEKKIKQQFLKGCTQDHLIDLVNQFSLPRDYGIKLLMDLELNFFEIRLQKAKKAFIWVMILFTYASISLILSIFFSVSLTYGFGLLTILSIVFGIRNLKFYQRVKSCKHIDVTQLQ